MKKLYILDAFNFLFRSYFAIGPMTNGEGESTGALYGFIRSLYKIINDFNTDYLVAVFDGPNNKKSRIELYSEYKGHRAAMPEDLFPQLENALEYCDMAGIPFLSVEGVEADDTMGSIAKWAEKKKIDIFICSSDKDLCQLVDDHIKVINPHKDNLLIDKDKVKELFGVRPDQLIDYLAMVGDASDNIPGLEGIGPKTAASLLTQFDTLDYILAHPDQISGKKQETIRSGKEMALLSRKLATIQLDVPFPKDEDFFRIKMPDLEKVKAFYHHQRFLSLLREIDTTAAPQHETKEEKVDYIAIDEEESLNALIAKLEKEPEICLDTETTDLRPMTAELVGIGLALKPHHAWYIPLNGKLGKKKVLDALRPLLEHPHISFYGHNIKYDLHALQNEGLTIHNISFDTMLASYLTAPQQQRHNLDALALDKFKKVKIPIEDLIGKGKKQISMADVPIDKVTTYCCEDVDVTCRLKGLFEKELEEKELIPVFRDIEIPLIPILFKMERKGIYVDVHKLKTLSHDLTQAIERAEKKIYELAGEEFNINSPKQLSKILFEKLGIAPPKKTTTGFSTAAEVLESLQEKAPIVKVILEYRTFEKLRSTYVDSLPHEVNGQTHRIHCTFNQSVAATGRLSCQDPNLQNIPIRGHEAKKIREAFRPEHAHHSFLSADYSQIELRLLAHLSEDPALLKAFQHGEDIHTYTASLVFDVPLESVTSDMRDGAKAVNFGILYGQQAYGLSQQLGIDFHEAQKFIDTYFKRYPRVADYIEFCKESVRKTGRAVTLTGRRRPIPEIHSKNPTLRAFAERLAINTPLQGTAADLIKLAMIQIDAHLEKHPEQGDMILQIHDELLFEVPDDQLDKLSHRVKATMEGVMNLKVPLTVHISIGKNWGEC